MILRSGINRRQVPQLKAELEKGTPIAELSKGFEVEPRVIFDFAKDWGIKLTETIESVALLKHEALIQAEVDRRVMALLEAKTKEAPTPKSKTTIDQPKRLGEERSSPKR